MYKVSRSFQSFTSFQADKRNMRTELKLKEKIISEMQEKLNGSAAQIKLEVEKVKSKLIIERHEWNKESDNQMAMVRELQKLLADERQIKDNLEMQLNDLKMQLTKNSSSGNRLSDLSAELEQTKRKLEETQQALSRNSAKSNDIAVENVLKKLQTDMTHLKKQHAAELQAEQNRFYLAEERNKQLAALHEERVASLESRLVELSTILSRKTSTTIGLYDRLRQVDQENTKLKETITQLNSSSGIDYEAKVEKSQPSVTSDKYTNWDVNELINEILMLYNVLLLENAKLAKPVDISRIRNAFNATVTKSTNEWCNCSERNESLLKENSNLRADIEQTVSQVETQKSHIKTLQSKIEVLNRNIDEQENELRTKTQDHKNELRAERNRWKEIVSNAEIEFRMKHSELEVQLQKQRERSLALLEEKENEIASLKASFDVFMMPPKPLRKRSETSNAGDVNTAHSSDSGDGKDILPQFCNLALHDSNDELNQTASKVLSSSSKEPMHMLHYVHEIARKEVEISNLRKAKYMAEQTLRQALQDKAQTQESLYEKISTLEEQVDRLERCKSRESANLEYLKNVFLSFLLSNDSDGRRHKVNAIGAVLEFNTSELQQVNKYFNFKDKK